MIFWEDKAAIPEEMNARIGIRWVKKRKHNWSLKDPLAIDDNGESQQGNKETLMTESEMGEEKR